MGERVQAAAQVLAEHRQRQADRAAEAEAQRIAALGPGHALAVALGALEQNNSAPDLVTVVAEQFGANQRDDLVDTIMTALTEPVANEDEPPFM